MIDFKCPVCGESMSVPDSLAGQVDGCPNPTCNRLVRVPSVLESQVPSKSVIRKNRGPWGGFKNSKNSKNGKKQCPKCKELIDEAATKCPHCRSKQPPPVWASTLAVMIVICLGVWLVHSCPSCDEDSYTSVAERSSERRRNAEVQRKIASRDASRDARRASQRAEVEHSSERPVRNAEVQREWYVGGTLHQATLREWKVASYRNKLATAADFITNFNNALGKRHQWASLKAAAEELVRGIDGIASDGIVDNDEASDIAAMILTVKEGMDRQQ